MAGSSMVFILDALNKTQIIKRENYFIKSNYGFTVSFSFLKTSRFYSKNSISILSYYSRFTEGFVLAPKNGVKLYRKTQN